MERYTISWRARRRPRLRHHLCRMFESSGAAGCQTRRLRRGEAGTCQTRGPGLAPRGGQGTRYFFCFQICFASNFLRASSARVRFFFGASIIKILRVCQINRHDNEWRHKAVIKRNNSNKIRTHTRPARAPARSPTHIRHNPPPHITPRRTARCPTTTTNLV